MTAQAIVPQQPTANRIIVSLSEVGVVRSRVSVAPFTNQMPQRPDGSFGVRGAVTLLNTDPSLAERSIDLVIQADEKLLVMGDTSVVQGSASLGGFLARFNSDGTRDTDFDFDSPVEGGIFKSLTQLADGKFLLSDGSLRRFNANGSLDVSFGSDGEVVFLDSGQERPARIRQAIVLPDGDIIAVGTLGDTPQAPQTWRLSAEGMIDTSFDGSLPDEFIEPGAIIALDYTFEKAAALPDGKIMVVGRALSEQRRVLMIIQFLADGTPDTAFGNGGQMLVGTQGDLDDLFTSLVPTDLQVQSDGAALIVTHENPFGAWALLKLTPEGVRDPAFGTNGALIQKSGNLFQNGALIAPSAVTTEIDRPTDLTILGNGSILIAGSTDNDTVFERYLADGQRDPDFGDDGSFRYNFSPANEQTELPVKVEEAADGGLILLSTAQGRPGVLSRSRLSRFVEVDATQ